MKSRTVIKKIGCISLIIFICFFFNHRTSVPQNPVANNVLSGNISIMVEKQYMHQYVMESALFDLSQTPTPEPTAAPTLEPIATPLPTLIPTPVPTPVPTRAPTSIPKPTATLAPTPEPLVALSEEMVELMTSEQSERSDLAYKILNNPRITLARAHPSGVRDNAFAYNNIVDTYFGNAAQRSYYQNAPGGSVFLSTKMLDAILLLAEKYTFTISEIAGASHSKTSNHYDGVAFDVGMINGRYASYNALSRSFAADAKNMGTTTAVVESTCVHIDFK